MEKFIKITYIDRINFFSDFYIKHYKSLFDLNEFLFIVDSDNLQKISNYLLENGFDNRNILSLKLEKSYGYGERTKLQNDLSKNFISKGYIVIYSDIDELIFHENLKEYILNNKDEYICPQGMFLIQNENENYFDIKNSILSQRNFCKIDNIWYSKVCILKKPYVWTAGRHNKPKNITIDNNVYLIDIGRICKKIVLENNNISSKLYKTTSFRYSILNKDKIENEFQLIYKSGLNEIPEIIKKYFCLYEY